MHAILLSFLSFGLGDESVHAAWHPADAGLYFEVPDATALSEVLDQTPLMDLLNDKNIQSLLKAVGVGEIGTVEDLSELVAGTLGVALPVSDLQEGIRATSISLCYDSDGVGVTAIIECKDEGLAAELKSIINGFADEAGTHALDGFETLNMAMLPLPLWLTVQGTRLAFGVSDETAMGLSERWKGGGSSLAKSPLLKDGLRALGSPKGTPVILGCYTGAFVLDELVSNDTFGETLESILSTPITVQTHFYEQRFETRIFIADGESDGEEEAAAASSHTDIQSDWLADLPDDAMLSYATTVDGAELAASMRGMIQGVATVDAALGSIEEKLGFSLEGFFEGLGPRLLVSVQPVMGLGLPPTLLWVDSEDPAGFVRNFEALASAIGEVVPGVGARTRDYRIKNKDTGERIVVPYTTLTLPPDLTGNMGMMLSPKPTLAQLEGRLIFSLSSTALKGELKRIFGGGTPKERDFLKKYDIDLPSGSESLFVFDWGVLLSKLVLLAKMLGPMAGDALPFDLNLLPPPETFGRYLKPTLHLGRRVEGGFLREHRSPFGVLTLGGLAVSALTLGRFSTGGPTVIASADAQPLKRSDETEGRLQDGAYANSEAALRDLKSGLAIYKIENGSLPETLDLLVTPTEAYPKGYLARPTVPRDGWDSDFRYVKESNGYRLWSIGADGRDQNGDGDDIVP